jgi:hypothetical protein
MDSVRFGRALGFGARQAAKTLITAVDAATADKPSGNPAQPSDNSKAAATASSSAAKPTAGPAAAGPASTPQIFPPAAKATAKAASTATRTAAQTRELREGVTRGSKQFGAAVWSPMVRLSGVLWLEVTGFFFGILAVFAGLGVWKARAELHAGTHQHLIGAVAMAAVFGYFCISSFMRARRRERQR